MHITSAEFIALNNKRKASFYAGKDKKANHHDFCALITQTLKNDLHVELSTEDVAMLVYEFHRVARGYARLYPGVFETLSQLRDRYTLSVVSYTQGCWTQPELKELGIEPLFSHFIYTSDLGFHKESSGFYKKCLEIVGEKAEDCVMIGDNYKDDVLIPQKLGIKTIWVKNPVTVAHYTHLFNHEPKNMIRIEEFNKLPEVVEQVFA